MGDDGADYPDKAQSDDRMQAERPEGGVGVELVGLDGWYSVAATAEAGR